MGETTGGVLRRGSDRILGGVCSGLAAYFGVDALLVRVIFVILALTPPGIGIILYLVLWFLMEPPQGTPHSATRNVGAPWVRRYAKISEPASSDHRRVVPRPHRRPVHRRPVYRHPLPRRSTVGGGPEIAAGRGACSPASS